jgi:hypothetical protein
MATLRVMRIKNRVRPGDRRAALREELWPNSKDRVWSPEEDGYCTMPRTVPLIATLISHFTPSMDASQVYLDLWARNYPEGIVEIANEQDIAASCGFAIGTRTVRSWRERINAIARLGFIEIKGKATRDYAYILMIHPHDAVTRLRKNPDRHIPEWWWDLYTSRLREIGAPIRPDPDAPPVSVDGSDQGAVAAPAAVTDGSTADGAGEHRSDAAPDDDVDRSVVRTDGSETETVGSIESRPKEKKRRRSVSLRR